MSDADRRDFFISYAGPDRPWAAWITSLLRSNGYSAEFDGWDWAPGTDAVEQMNGALERADRVLALWSPRYFDSASWAGEELSAAMMANHETKGRLVPVRVESCTPPPMYAPLVTIDLVDRDERSASAELLARLRGDLGQFDEQPFPGRTSTTAAMAPALYPTDTPAIWRAPARNPGFVGRDEMLDALRERLVADGTVALEALQGMGGVGKSQLAIEYVHRYAGEYELVWWIDAEQTALIPDQLARLAVKLGQPEDISGPAAVAAVLEHLRLRERWLLVYDNAASPEDLADFRPSGRGAVLVTSREPGWGALGGKVEVDAFAREESLALLQRRLPGIDRAVAAELAAELEDLPLAIAQAAGYIETRGTPAGTYLALWRSKREQLVSEGMVADHALLATTWAVSLADLEENEPAALELLQLASFLASEPIPLNLLRDGRDLLPDALAQAVAEPLAVEDALGGLWKRALIRRGDDVFEVHRLIQTVTRAALEKEVRPHVLKSTMWALANAAPAALAYEPAAWPVWQTLLPHILVVIGDHADEAERAAPGVLRWLTDRAATYLLMRGDLEQALPLFEISAAIARRDEVETSPRARANSLANLAGALGQVGDPERSLALQREVLSIVEQEPDVDPGELATTVLNLGVKLVRVDELDEALDLVERGMELAREAYGECCSEVARAFQTRGMILSLRADFAGARECHIRAVEIEEEVTGPTGPRVAVHLAHLAYAEGALGDVERAITLTERAREINMRVFGAGHPNVLRNDDDLAELRRASARPGGE